MSYEEKYGENFKDDNVEDGINLEKLRDCEIFIKTLKGLVEEGQESSGEELNKKIKEIRYRIEEILDEI